MINYVFIHYPPGAAGNFFSRCISLASDRCYGQVQKNSSDPFLSLEDKFNLYQYQNRCSNWIDFEYRLQDYYSNHPHYDLPDVSFSIWKQHPSYEFLLKDIAGPDDKKHTFYIDPSKHFEWCVLNCLYKNSYIDSKWLMEGKKMLSDDNIIKIDLWDIIDNKDTFIGVVENFCNIIGLTLENTNKQKIQQLWDQWILTTLPKTEFSVYKNSIGYFDT